MERKNVTARDFALSLDKAYRLYGLSKPSNSVNSLKTVLATITSVFRKKIDENAHIESETVLEEDAINKIVSAYAKNTNKYNSPNWYNLLRQAAWNAARIGAFHDCPVPAPEALPKTILKREFAYHYGWRDANRKFESMVSKMKLNGLLTIDANSFGKMVQSAKSNEVKEALEKVFKNHFVQSALPEAVYVDIAADTDATKEASQPVTVDLSEKDSQALKDCANAISLMVNGIIMQLQSISKSEYLELTNEEKEAILGAIGSSGEDSVLKAKVQELEAANANLMKELENRKGMAEKLEELKRMVGVA